MSYVEFLIDLAGEGHDRTIPKRIAGRPTEDLRPTTAFVWKVICDAEQQVIVIACADVNGLAVIATARRGASGLTQLRRLASSTVPTSYQWKLVEDALQANLDTYHKGDATIVDVAKLARGYQRRARSVFVDQPADDEPPVAPRRRVPWVAIGAVAATVVAGIAIMLSVAGGDAPAKRRPAPPRPAAPTPPPAPPAPAPPATIDEAIARSRTEVARDDLGPRRLTAYASAKLRWSDVDVPAETSLGHVLKDWEAERGKRLCVEGTLASIERRDLDGRKLFVGRLTTGEGDAIAFTAVGSTGDLVRHRRGKLCGIVTGKLRLLGMFDLPENRHPIVEH